MLRSPLSSRAALVAARLLAVAAVVATGLAVALPLVTGGDWLLQLFRTPEPVAAPAFAVTGALLIGLRPARRLGWLLLVIGCSAATYVLATSWWVAAGQTGPVGGLRSWSWVPALLLVTSVRMRAFFTAGAGVVAKPFPELSDREREVLYLIAAGMPNATIARRLFLSEKTVRNYITAIFAKLGVRDRAEAVVRAREAGLGRGTGP
jgi:DNA-binding CsgD family transcriptional regulator